MRERQFDRYNVNLDFSFHANGMRGEHRKLVKNLGCGGLCFRASGALPPGTRIDGEIRFPGQRQHIDGKLAWCHLDPQGLYEMGVAFDQAIDEQLLQAPAMHLRPGNAA